MKLLELKYGPTETWKGNCYAVATKLVREGVMPKGSTAVYGHWTGPVHDKSMFAGKPVIAHGWVLLPDGTVCDPTRWVFENAKPYIYFGPADHYDEGGNQLRKALGGGPPEFDESTGVHRLTKSVLNAKAWTFVEKLLKLADHPVDDRTIDAVATNQLSWLANRPPAELGEHVIAIYAALARLRLKALIPIDNWRMVERRTKIAV